MNTMILYHYTTASGLEGIIRTKSIWTSDYRFLNDATEFNYGLSIFDEIFASRSPRSFRPEVVEFIGNFRRATSDFSLLIASFCQHPDLLSQWRAYSGAVGYAIGFNADWLRQNAEAQGFQLMPVCYDIRKQKRLIRDKIRDLNKLTQRTTDPASLMQVARSWWGELLVTIGGLKNAHFREEDEYRLVKATYFWPPGICTRPSNQGLIPYQPVKLDAIIVDNLLLHPNNVGIERIIVGPALRDQQRAAVDALLTSQRMRLSTVKSKIPFLPT